MSSKVKVEKPLLFLSFDIEADGPCPGLNNMYSIGIACFTVDGKMVYEFEANLYELEGCKSNPDTVKWWKTQPEALEYARSNVQDPVVVFNTLNKDILRLKETYKIKPVGWPINYDWQWINYYFHRFIKSNPLGYCAYDMDSYAWGALKSLKNPKAADLKRWDDPRFKHTHKAIDDAKEQGARFVNMYRENTGITEK